MDWVSEEEALAITGVALTDDQLVNAAEDVYDYLRWEPDPTRDLLNVELRTVARQKKQLGRAIAWQAAFRTRNSALLSMDRAAISESIGRYSVTFASNRVGQAAGTTTLADKVRRILDAAGLCRHSGYSRDEIETDDETFIEVS